MRLLIVEDHPLILMGLKLLIRDLIPEVEIFQAQDYPEGLAIAGQEPVDVVILDIDVPGGEDIRMMPAIREKQPDVTIIIHTGFDEYLYAATYLDAGADFFLSKRASSDQMKAVLSEILTLSKQERTARKVSAAAEMGNVMLAGDEDLLKLSPVEMRVTQLIVEGKWNKEIASIMNLKGATISTYRKRIYDKLGVNDPIQLAKKISGNRTR